MDNPAGDNNTPTSTALAFRPHRPAGSSGREDCWSEDATAILIEAWGERHLRCNRGNLRQNDWREVADAVNGREDRSKPSKSDIQCKNRIDTLKKKYKLEKAKTGPSCWRFFNRIDYLIGPAGSSGVKKFGAVSPDAGGGGPFLAKNHPNRFTANPNSTNMPNSNPRLSGVWSRGSSSRFNSPESSDESESSLRSAGENNNNSERSGRDFGRGGRGRKHGRLEEEANFAVEEEGRGDNEEKTAFRELAKAIVKFGEIYERIESSKQKQIMDLEKQRMEFAKEIEFQRMNMLMDAQLEIEKLKRAKNGCTAAGKKV